MGLMRAVVVLVALLLGLGLAVAPPAASGDEGLDPWRALKAGDWVKFRSRQANDVVVEQTWRVTKADAQRVEYVVESVTFDKGRQLGKPTKSDPETVALSGEGAIAPPKLVPETDAASAKRSEAVVELKDGRKLACTVYELSTEADGVAHVTQIWSSADVPFGLVKVMTDGNVKQELVDFGRD